MQSNEPLDILPLWALLLGVFVLVLLSVEVGYRLGKAATKDEEEDTPLGEMVGATLGLLAFLLAFTFSLSASRYDVRRQLLLDEANAIGTTYLRAGLLPEGTAEIRALLRHYTDVRLQAPRARDLQDSIHRSEQLQSQLWERITPLAKRGENPVIVGLFIQSLNELIDLHSKRVTASIRNRIPPAIWAALYCVTVLSFGALGYHGGLVRSRRSFAIFPVAFTFAVVIGLIADLDRPQEGTLKVGQEPLIDVLRSMDSPSGP